MVCRQICTTRRLLRSCFLIHIASLCILAYVFYEHGEDDHGPQNDIGMDREEVVIRNKQDGRTYRPMKKEWHLRYCTFNITQCASAVDAFVLMGRPKTLTQLTEEHPDVVYGHWEPDDCVSQSRVAIVIPFRDREKHLLALLQNLIPILKFQRVAFGIFVVEQLPGVIFNKGLLMNAGFTEIQRLFSSKYDCFIFHDVDMLLENRCNLYTCSEKNPLHLGAYVSKFRYKLLYPTLVGGVLSLPRDTMTSLNGFTNLLYGWGDEDDNMAERIKLLGYGIDRHPCEVSRYTMLQHSFDHGNPHRPRRAYEPVENLKYLKFDGLTTANYSVVYISKEPLYTHIGISISGPRSARDIHGHFVADMARLETLYQADPEWQQTFIKMQNSSAKTS